MTIEDLIRDAQERQADRAVPADRIRSALPRRAARAQRHRRYGMLGAGLAAAAVAAAVTVPAVVLRDDNAATTATTQPAAPAASAVPAAPSSYELGYRATWAPAGFAERIRHTSTGESDEAFGPTVMRVWSKNVGPGDPWGGPQLTLYVRTEVPDPAKAMDTSGQRVDINGVPGYYAGVKGSKSAVNWALGEHTTLTLAANHLDISESDLLRMARSVRPDPGVTSIPVRLGWLPQDWTSGDVTVSGKSPGSWRAQVFADRRDPEPVTKESVQASELSVIVGSTAEAPAGGKELTVAGRPARNPVRTDEPGRDLVYLVVDLGDGRLMTLVGAGLTLDEVKRVAEHVEITPTGLDWLGR